MARIRVLVVGATSWPEFRPCLRVVDGLDEATVRRCPHLSLPGEHDRYDLVLLLQRYPGEHRIEDLEGLRARLPLARLLVILGSWCEGEVRSGQPLPGVIRYYWHQWLASCGEPLRLWRQGHNPAWDLPPTATDEDLALAEASGVPNEAALPRRQARPTEKPPVAAEASPASAAEKPGLAVVARDYAVFEWLQAAAHSWNMACQWYRSPAELANLSESAAIVVDLEHDGDLPPRQLRSLRTRLRKAWHDAPIVLLMGFPRLHQVNRYLRAGAAAILSKPCTLSDLERIVRIRPDCVDRLDSPRKHLSD